MELINMVFPALAACVFAWPVLILWFRRRKKTGHALPVLHQAGVCLFTLYLCGVWWFTGIGIPSSFDPRFVLVPFADLFRGPDTILNVILFVPLGIFLPVLYSRFSSLRSTAAAGLLLSCLIEGLQMFGLGITDINDLFTNLAGACIGYGRFRLLKVICWPHLLFQFRASGPDQLAAPVEVIILSLVAVAFVEKPLLGWILRLSGLV